jgi:serine/threonine-protein kinase HipA
MTDNAGKCLFCQGSLEAKSDFHPRCSRKFFGSTTPPRMEWGLDEMEQLADKVIRSHSAIPGVQAKISLDMEDSGRAGKNGRLTLVGLWGRFILKPPTRAYPSMPEVEAMTMHLAGAAGLPIVPFSLIRLRTGELAYITKRIDRDGTMKIAMEDMCQLTERLTEDKYKGSLEQIGKAIRLHSIQPGLDAIRFFELVLFCFLTGNSDMHLKNFSLWQPSREGPELAPAYDLVATSLLLPQDTEETALALNGKKRNLRRKDFDSLALSLELPVKARDNAYSRMSGSNKAWQARLDEGFLSGSLKGSYGALLNERLSGLGLG